MDTSTKKERKRNPVENANPLSLLTLAYMFPIFYKTYRTSLSESDLFTPLNEHKSSMLGDRLEVIWRKEFKKHKKTALHRSLFKLFGPYYFLIGAFKCLQEVMLVVVIPLSIGRLVAYFEKNQTRISQSEAYYAALGIILTLFIDTFTSHPCLMALAHITMKMRVACSSLVYRKIMRLNKTSLASTTVGQVVNLLSNDVSKFEQGFMVAHFVWIAPIQTAIGTYFIYREIGVSAFFGMAFLLLFVPLQIWLGKKTSDLRLKTALRTDERVRLMNEIISGIQVIKMYCWEKPFAKLIQFAREREMRTIKAHAYILGVIYSFETFVSRTALFLSLLGYVLLGNSINAEKVFAITAIYNVLKPVITILFSISITAIAEVNVSVIRIQTFLSNVEKSSELDELKPLEINGLKAKLVEVNGLVQPSIRLDNVTAKWLGESCEPTLRDVSLEMSARQVVAVIGPVGSGKSSLLNVLLKELPVESGALTVRGVVSYSAQEPWLFAGSVRQNVLFGAEFDEERYKTVVDVCALRADFERMAFGDRTLVGERGGSLSGGQRARINLARCIYKKADIYLLDDPLSAVDANVGKHLYEKCVQRFLADKITLLITHQLQYLSSADQIVIMKEGRVEMVGTYHELQTSGLDFAKLLASSGQGDKEEENEKKIRSRQNSVSVSETELFEESPDEEEETMKSGSISNNLYWKFLRSGGSIFNVFFLLFTFVACQIFSNYGDYYVSYWVNSEENFKVEHAENFTNDSFSRNTIIYTYSGLTLGTILLSLVHSLYLLIFFIIASVNLHRTSFNSIINGSMRFFNQNPSGRILNRFSKDLGYIDEHIPPLILEVLEVLLTLAGTLVLSTIVNPYLALPSCGMLVLFYFLRKVYIKTSQSVKRIESITRSPIFSHMTASMHGLSTIRSFGAEKLLIEEFDNYQDNHSSAWFLFIASSRCFGLWLDVISICVIAFVILMFLYYDKMIYSGDIGLIITQFIGMIGILQWGMRQWSELENLMVSFERIIEYQSIESEPHREPLENKPKDWPAEGRLVFEAVSLRYGPTEAPVLNRLDFAVEPREKIGIVGRTGAGKSSTIAALFQLHATEGRILLDGVDAARAPLADLRAKISIIPQEPVLFSGTLRQNLDPFEEFADGALWAALAAVRLKEAVAELPAGLHSAVAEAGANFSVGQRQLVCLARALIRNNKVLVMDEATANVDPKTDALIQETIRAKFAECTVLTIAHRLHTVMDSDRILVMEAGRVKEFDTPYNLLQNKEGLLSNLVLKTGKTTAHVLERIAEDSNEKKVKHD